VTLHPGEVWAVGYRLSTSRDMQDFDGLNSVAGDLPVAAMSGGKLCAESGAHQEIAVTRKAGNGMIRAVVYHDSIRHPEVAGTGAADPAELASSGAVVDTATGSFRFLARDTRRTGSALRLPSR